MSYDVVIRNGTIVDGSGAPSYPADVGIRAGLIATIGRIGERGAQEVDAQGHVVTPGFIDGHTHMDAQVFWDELGSCSCWHGVTTVVMGHCGFTLAPASSEQRHLVLRNLERSEDISARAMELGIDWSWTTFAEYLDAVDRLPKGINYAANLGHSALRTFAMGERAFVDPATDEDLDVMARELRDALAAGAFGFTTSRTANHQTSDDRPVASRLATWDEVRFLVAQMGDLGAGIFQITEDMFSTEEGRADVRERLTSLSAETGVPIAFNAPSRPEARMLDLLDAADPAGAQLFGLAHPRGVGTMASFKTHLPFDRLPEWESVRALPLAEQRAALRDPEVRRRLVWSAHHGTYPRAIGTEPPKPDFDQMRVLDRPCPPNPTVAEAARARGVDPVELMIDLALESDFEQFFYQIVGGAFDYEAVKALLRHPRAVMTFSDAGAHVSQISDCSIHTHMLEYWVRTHQEFTLEAAVRMMTFAPSRVWGFSDRGLVREGLVADLNVFDPDRVGPAMPTVVDDLPGGERRIKQTAIGFLATIVGGQVVHRDGEHTGALPGRLIRGPLAASRPS